MLFLITFIITYVYSKYLNILVKINSLNILIIVNTLLIYTESEKKNYIIDTKTIIKSTIFYIFLQY